MTPAKGVEKFLLEPTGRGEMDTEAIEAAIEFAIQFAPSSAFDRAQAWWQLRRAGGQWNALGFAKGVRWLAMLRRDEAAAIFATACHQLRLASRL